MLPERSNFARQYLSISAIGCIGVTPLRNSNDDKARHAPHVISHGGKRGAF